jgi:hypothetical protein
MYALYYIVYIHILGWKKLDVSFCQKNNKEKIPKTIGKDHYYKNPPGWYNGWNNTTRDELVE